MLQKLLTMMTLSRTASELEVMRKATSSLLDGDRREGGYRQIMNEAQGGDTDVLATWKRWCWFDRKSNRDQRWRGTSRTFQDSTTRMPMVSSEDYGFLGGIQREKEFSSGQISNTT